MNWDALRRRDRTRMQGSENVLSDFSPTWPAPTRRTRSGSMNVPSDVSPRCVVCGQMAKKGSNRCTPCGGAKPAKSSGAGRVQVMNAIRQGLTDLDLDSLTRVNDMVVELRRASNDRRKVEVGPKAATSRQGESLDERIAQVITSESWITIDQLLDRLNKDSSGHVVSVSQVKGRLRAQSIKYETDGNRVRLRPKAARVRRGGGSGGRR